VAVQGTKRAGSRKGHRGHRTFRPRLLLLGLAAVLALAAWLFLVRAAIDFGQSARGGESAAWMFLGLASLGAVACLFLSLMLVTVILRAVGILSERKPHRH
jgi:hypothetical protein